MQLCFNCFAITPLIITCLPQEATYNICNPIDFGGKEKSTCSWSFVGTTQNTSWLQKLRATHAPGWDSNNYQGLLNVTLSSNYTGSSQRERFLKKLWKASSFELVGQHHIDTSQRTIFIQSFHQNFPCFF